MKTVIGGALLGLAAIHSAQSQSAGVADSTLQRGNLARAESLYYAAARVRPRDPIARRALGRYIAGRGATRVAVTLLEEAIQFGGDKPLINAELAPLYLQLGDYHALTALSPSPLPSDERERARWLEAHPTRLIAPDSVLVVSYRAASDSGFLGHIPIRINGRIVDALIAVGTTGVVVSDSFATAIQARRFPARAPERAGSANIPASVDSIGIGRLVLTNFPVRVGPAKAPAVIGVNILGQLAPTFEPKTGRVTIRTSGSVPPGIPGDRFSTWSTLTDLRLLQGGGWISVGNPQIARLLADRSWTLDAKRGILILGR